MQLQDLGWTAAWQSAFEEIDRGDLEPARVLEEQKGFFRIFTAGGELHAGLAGRLRHEARSRADLPAVGDWVAAFAGADRATIHRVLPRRSALVRKAADRLTEAQTLAANLDFVFIVMSLNRDFNPRRLERYLMLVWESGAAPVVVLTKADLVESAATYRADAEVTALGVSVHVLSALRGEGLEELDGYLAAGKTAALVGSSGVGKSTLINALAGATLQRVEEVRADDARGRHTTTARQLIRLPAGALLIDTPGLREVGLWDAGGLADAFADIEGLGRRCRFRDCSHQHEPGCVVQAALAEGRLEGDRLASYHKLQRELAHLKRRQDQQASLEERRRNRRRTAAYRQIHRRNPKRR